jgi:PAS domain S-box-containing protein
MQKIPVEPVLSAKRVEVLGDFDRAARSLQDPREVLQLAADTIVSLRLFRRVVISLHDDQGNLGPIGHAGIPRELIEAAKRAPRVRKEVREAILQDRFLVGESYFVPSEAGIDLHGEARHIPSEDGSFRTDGWQAGDELFTPLRRADRTVMGFCSVDEPFDGQRPRAASLQPLEDIVVRASAQIEFLEIRRQLDAIQSRWQRRLEQTSYFIYEVDMATNRFVAANPAVTTFTGVPHSEILGLSLDEWVRRFIHPEDRERVRSMRLSLFVDSNNGRQRTTQNDYRIVHRDGSVRWVADVAAPVVDADGQLVMIEGAVKDITALRKLAEERDEAVRRYRLIAENARDIIYAHDKTGHMFYVSPSLERYLGVTPEEFLGTHFSDWLTDDPINQAAFEAFDAEINSGRVVAPFVLELRSKDGRVFLMEFNESLIRDEADEVIGVQGVGRDITDREHLLHSLKDQQKRLDSANRSLRMIVTQARRRQQEAVDLSRRLQAKNAELESFVHIVSHDLRSPLVTVRGLLGQLRRLYARRLDERGRDITRRLDTEAARLLRLVGDLVVYVKSGADPSARRAIDAGLLIESVWTRLVESGVATQAQLTRPADKILLWSDPVALERIFENLLVNAVTHCCVERPPKVEIVWQRQPDSIQIEVRDTGIGIEPEDRPHIFELFFRGRNVTAVGSGVGLAIVRRIVDSSGASIAYTPNPAGGSVFTLIWPANPPP